MKTRKHLVSTVLILARAAAALSVTANEPLWTDQERLENRDMVCVGTVASVSRIERIDQYKDLYLAVVEISAIKKGAKTLTGSNVNIYYEFSSSGRNDRCPRYAELSKGEKGTFYLRDLTDQIRKDLKIQTLNQPAFFLEMGSDVKKEVVERRAVKAEAQSQLAALEGILKIHPKYLYKYYITGFGDGQACALVGEDKLQNIKVGSLVHVEGRLGTGFHPGGTPLNPSPWGRDWYIFMDVVTVKVLREPEAEKPTESHRL